MLSRFFSLLHTHNPELAGEKRRYTIVPPQVARDGTKKTVFSNLTDICRRMHRQPEHVIQFLYSELGTQGSVDGAQRLVMKGRYTPKQIENLLRRYIGMWTDRGQKADDVCVCVVEYVTCKICKSPDTLLGKENRLYFMTCETCGSRESEREMIWRWLREVQDGRCLRSRRDTRRRSGSGSRRDEARCAGTAVHILCMPGICLPSTGPLLRMSLVSGRHWRPGKM